MNNKLFVGNLAYSVSESQLHDAFAAHGVVVDCHIMTDRATGRPRGFAFVTMSTEEEAQAAIEAMNGATLDDRALTVNIARPREERAGGGGGGGGSGGGGGGFSRGPRRGFDDRGGRRGGGGGGGGRDRY